MPSSMLVLFFILKPASGFTKMALMWGTPNNSENCSSTLQTDWMSCVESCYYANNCVLAYSNPLNSSFCGICPFKSVKKVKELTKSDGKIVAFKIERSTEQCPATKEEYMKGNLSIELYSNVYYYTIRFTNNYWKFNYTVYDKCNGLTWFPRKNVQWCIWFRLLLNVAVNHTFAVTRCSSDADNFVIAGFENEDEFNVAKALFNQSDYASRNNTKIWLDGSTTNPCNNCNKTAVNVFPLGLNFRRELIFNAAAKPNIHFWREYKLAREFILSKNTLQRYTFVDKKRASTYYNWETDEITFSANTKYCPFLYGWNYKKTSLRGKVGEMPCNTKTPTTYICGAEASFPELLNFHGLREFGNRYATLINSILFCFIVIFMYTLIMYSGRKTYPIELRVEDVEEIEKICETIDCLQIEIESNKNSKFSEIT